MVFLMGSSDLLPTPLSIDSTDCAENIFSYFRKGDPLDLFEISFRLFSMAYSLTASQGIVNEEIEILGGAANSRITDRDSVRSAQISLVRDFLIRFCACRKCDSSRAREFSSGVCEAASGIAKHGVRSAAKPRGGGVETGVAIGYPQIHLRPVGRSAWRDFTPRRVPRLLLLWPA
jgi:hypothetical protein